MPMPNNNSRTFYQLLRSAVTAGGGLLGGSKAAVRPSGTDCTGRLRLSLSLGLIVGVWCFVFLGRQSSTAAACSPKKKKLQASQPVYVRSKRNSRADGDMYWLLVCPALPPPLPSSCGAAVTAPCSSLSLSLFLLCCCVLNPFAMLSGKSVVQPPHRNNNGSPSRFLLSRTRRSHTQNPRNGTRDGTAFLLSSHLPVYI